MVKLYHVHLTRFLEESRGTVFIRLEHLVLGCLAVGAVAALPGAADGPRHVAQGGLRGVEAGRALDLVRRAHALAVARVVAVRVDGPIAVSRHNDGLGAVVVGRLGNVHERVLLAADKVFVVV